MNRRVAVVLALMVVLVALLVIFALTHQRPPVPRDADHLRSDAIDYCLTCHARGKAHARPKNHPLNDRCWECHERAR